MTAAEIFPNSGSSSQLPEVEGISLSSTVGKERSSVLEGSDPTLSQTTSLGRGDGLVTLEDGTEQVALANGRIEHSAVVVEAEITAERQSLVHVDEVVVDSPADEEAYTQEESGLVDNELYESTARPDSEGGQRESTHSFRRESHEYEPASSSAVQVDHLEGYGNKAFTDDESDDRTSSFGGTDYTNNSAQNLLSSLNTPSPMSRLRKVQADNTTSPTSRREGSTAYRQSLSHEETESVCSGCCGFDSEGVAKKKGIRSRGDVSPARYGICGG